MTILFIAGLPRSGTTYLQYVLAKYKDVVALGEVTQTVRAIRSEKSNDNTFLHNIGIKKKNHWNERTYPVLLERIRNDTFWSCIENEIKKAATVEDAVVYVYKYAHRRYPNCKVFVDASKHINYILPKKKLPEECNMSVIVLIRDFRGWIQSRKKHIKRTNLKKRSFFKESLNWYYSNKRILKSEKVKAYPFKVILYESLVFNYKKVVDQVTCFLGLPELYKEKSIIHEILGSETTKKLFEGEQFPTKENKLFYDTSWFDDNQSYLLFPLIFPVIRFNRSLYKHYYSSFYKN